MEGGAWTCLLGGSGVGKTTLLRFVAGLTDGPGVHTRGQVVCGDGRPLKNRIAWMSQQDSLMPWATVLDNVTLGERLRHTSSFFTSVFKGLMGRNQLPCEVTDLAREILGRVGLAGKEQELPQKLSGGQRQRVALARTLFEDRPVVLMDEPFGALDAITRLNLQDLACELLQGRTVLLITHDPLEALRLGHHVYHLRVHLKGKLAVLTDAITPPGQTPRSLENTELMALQGQLLDRLRHEGVS